MFEGGPSLSKSKRGGAGAHLFQAWRSDPVALESWMKLIPRSDCDVVETIPLRHGMAWQWRQDWGVRGGAPLAGRVQRRGICAEHERRARNGLKRFFFSKTRKMPWSHRLIRHIAGVKSAGGRNVKRGHGLIRSLDYFYFREIAFL